MKGLQEKMKEKEVSIRGLAKELNLTYANLRLIYHARINPRMDTLLKIMKYFNDYDLKNYL